VLHREIAKENCWLGKKKEKGKTGENARTLQNHVSFMLAAALNIISAAPATRIHFFCGETTAKTLLLHITHTQRGTWRQQVKLKYLMKRLMCNFPSSPQL